jgi:hypothetical protein
LTSAMLAQARAVVVDTALTIARATAMRAARPSRGREIAVRSRRRED